MKIAQVSPLYEAVPPALYGGTERVVSWLTEELVAAGHDVTLFASGDSRTSARLEAVWPRALRLDGSVRDPIAPHVAMIEQVLCRSREFDLIHFHLDYLPFSSQSRSRSPCLTTLHGRLDLPEHACVLEAFPDVPLVSISDSQRAPAPDANWAATIHHGMPVDLLRPTAAKPEYLAFIGRVSPEKRVDRAIRIARRCGIPIRVAAKIETADLAYYEEVARPLFGLPGVDFIGEIGDADKAEFLSGALALLMPIDWPEPFGLVMIEAMACGTPVIVFNRGSAPEIVENGVTGFVVENMAEAEAAVTRLGQLSRATIRQRFEARFSATRMARDYEAIYHAMARGEKQRPRLVVV